AVTDISLAAQGNLTDIKNFLDSLSFVPDTNWSGTATISVQITADYTTRLGADITTRSFNVIVSSVADAPQGANATLTTVEDTPITLTPDNFGFSDPNDTTPNTLSAVKITTLPGLGTLTLSGGATTVEGHSTIAVGDYVSAANIAAGNLIYTPAQNGKGTGYANFTFQVKDDGSITVDGGVVLDPTPNTLTFNVTPVNDAPTATLTAVSDVKNQLVNFALTSTDPDGGSDNATDAQVTKYRISHLPADGKLYYRSDLTNYTEITTAAIASGYLEISTTQAAHMRYVPAINVTGDKTFAYSAVDAAGLESADSTVTITIAVFNEPPVVTVPGSQTVAEDGSLTFTGISISDVDDQGASFQVTLSAVHGNLTLGDITGLTGLTGLITNTSHSVTLQGTMAAINTALGTSGYVTYSPDANYPNSTSSATDTITVVADDLVSGSGAGAHKTDTKTITVTVTPVADAPRIAVGSAAVTLDAVNEDSTSPSGASVANLLSGKFNDVDTNTLAGIAISANPSAVDGTSGAWQFSLNNGQDWTAVGSVSSSSALMLNTSSLLRFLPASNYSGTPGALTIHVIDTSGSRSYTTDKNSPVKADISISGDLLADEVLTVARFQVTGDATVYTVGETATIAGKGALTIAATGVYSFIPVAGWDGRVPVVTATLSNDTTSSLTIVCTDIDSVGTTLGTGITAVNDVMQVVTDKSLVISEGLTSVLSSAVLQITDVEAAAANIVYTLGTIPDHVTITKSGITLVATDTFTQDDIDNNRITFTHDGTEPADSGTSLTLGYTVTDMMGSLGTALTRSLTIQVSPVNDVPVLTVHSAAPVTQGSALNITSSILSVVDPDNVNDQLIFRLESLPSPTAGSLTIGGAPVAIGSTFSYADLVTGTVVVYTAASSGSAVSDSFSVSLRDGAGGVVGGSTPFVAVGLTITPLNTAPYISGSQAASSTSIYLPLNEGATGVAVFPNTTFSDAQTAADYLTVTILTLPTTGDAVLKYNGSAIAAGFNFLATNANKALLTIDHVSTNQVNPPDTSFTISVTDNNVTTPLSLDATVSVKVQAVNDDPVGTRGTAT
ncbi:MAG: cadherin-like domain-containing protein, partial [Desulfuromonadales bacterium]